MILREPAMAGLAADLEGTGVTPNVLVPDGTTNTPLAADWDASLRGAQPAEKAGTRIACLGIARMPIEPQ